MCRLPQVPVERVVYKPPPREAITRGETYATASRGETYATSASYGATYGGSASYGASYGLQGLGVRV